MTDNEKRIREALEAGPTEGPFITFNDQVYRATDPDLTTPVASWNTAGFTMEGVSIDALYYAACNPSAIRALLADLDAMRGALFDAFQEGYWARSTYNDAETSDLQEEWNRSTAKDRAALKGASA